MKRMGMTLGAAVLALSVLSAEAVEGDLVKLSSGHDVAQTMDALEGIVKDKGMAVFARIDHGANAAAAGLEMPPAEVLVFGKPEAGTALMNNDIRVGLDLPMRVLVYEDTEGKVWLLYHNPGALAEDYVGLPQPVLEKLESAMAAITAAAAD